MPKNITLPLETFLNLVREDWTAEDDGPAQSHPYIVGENYLIRTVTMTLTGKLIGVGAKELVLESAAWIADTGRFSQSIADPKASLFNEVEPFPDGKQVIVGRGSIIDAVQISTLPRSQK
mgnify:FL=1